jgi:hypothetical protein
MVREHLSVLELLSKAVEAGAIQARQKTRVVRHYPVGFRGASRRPRGKSTPDRFVDDLLEGFAPAMNLLLEELHHVRVERERRTHVRILMLSRRIVKMT